MSYNKSDLADELKKLKEQITVIEKKIVAKEEKPKEKQYNYHSFFDRELEEFHQDQANNGPSSLFSSSSIGDW